MTEQSSPPPVPYASRQTPRPAPDFPRPRPWRFTLYFWLAFIVVAVVLFLLLSQRRTPVQSGPSMPFSEFTERLQAGQITHIAVSGNDLHGDFVPSPASLAASLPSPAPLPFHTPLRPGLADSWPFYEWLLAHRNGAVITVEPDASRDNSYLVNFLFWFVPWLVIFFVLWLLFVRPLQRRLGATPPASS